MKGKRLYGELGEDFAVRILQSRGYQLIEKNFRSSYGEIDIIVRDGDTYVFVEVKTRWSKKFGFAVEAVTPAKIHKIKRAIDYYFLVKKLKRVKSRIEVVAIDIEDGKVLNAKIVKVD